QPRVVGSPLERPDGDAGRARRGRRGFACGRRRSRRRESARGAGCLHSQAIGGWPRAVGQTRRAERSECGRELGDAMVNARNRLVLVAMLALLMSAMPPTPVQTQSSAPDVFQA